VESIRGVAIVHQVPANEIIWNNKNKTLHLQK